MYFIADENLTSSSVFYRIDYIHILVLYYFPLRCNTHRNNDINTDINTE